MRAKLTPPRRYQVENLPPGYRHIRQSAHLGHGREALERAATALFTWRMHEGAGLHVTASGPAAKGSVVMVRLSAWGLATNAPCRVVAVIDEPNRRGFAYGTLPGHPERGEELFMVEMESTGTVTATITAFSRAESVPAKLGFLAARLMQNIATNRYLRALQIAATNPR